MPDLLDDLRRYGDAVEAAALEQSEQAYPITPIPVTLRRRPSRRTVLVGVAAALLLALVASIAMLRAGEHDSVRIDTPPTTIAPTRPQRVPATVLPASDATWTQMAPSPLSTRGGASALWTGSALLVWGGVDTLTPTDRPNYAELADGASYDPAGDHWTVLPPAPIEGRGYAVSAWTGSEMVVFGGGGPSYEAATHIDGAAYDPTDSTWRTIAPSPLPLGPHYEGVWTGERLVVAGVEGSIVHMASYDPEADTWTRVPGPALTPTAAGDARLMIAAAGSHVVVAPQPLSYGEPAQIFVLDLTSGEWTKPNAPAEPFALYEMVGLDDVVVAVAQVIAAYDEPVPITRDGDRIERGPSDDIFQLDPREGGWTAWVSVPDLGCVGGYVLEPTISSVFITACGVSGFYDPDRTTWQPVDSATPGPAEHVIWTGERLLWIGSDAAESGVPAKRIWSLTP